MSFITSSSVDIRPYRTTIIVGGSGTYTPTAGLRTKLILIGGGGAGGSSNAMAAVGYGATGGGGGETLIIDNLYLFPTPYDYTVGVGGVSSLLARPATSFGQDTLFAGFVARGGVAGYLCGNAGYLNSPHPVAYGGFANTGNVTQNEISNSASPAFVNAPSMHRIPGGFGGSGVPGYYAAGNLSRQGGSAGFPAPAILNMSTSKNSLTPYSTATRGGGSGGCTPWGVGPNGGDNDSVGISASVPGCGGGGAGGSDVAYVDRLGGSGYRGEIRIYEYQY